MDYDFARVDLTSDSEPHPSRRTGFLQAVRRGFHGSRSDEEFERHWLAHVRADDAVVAGAWLPDDAFGAGPIPVATISWFDKDLNLGLERVPLRMITDVTTSPAHRRRGLVRRLITDCLEDANGAGLPVCALTVSEATIYGRWGFGAATFRDGIELDTGPRFGLRDFTDPGRMELIEPAQAWPSVRAVFERFHAETRGSVAWPQFYEVMHSAGYDIEEGGPDKKLRGAVHLDAQERVDGFVLYRSEGKKDGVRTVQATEMIALDPSVQLALWQFLGSIDLVGKVTYTLARPDDPLLWALRDMNVLRYVDHEEFLWVRVLDVPRTLQARPWAANGAVVLEVADPQGYATGRYRISTEGGRAVVERTREPGEIALEVETLGSLSLGGARVQPLAAAGRLHGAPEAVRRFAAMADLATPPYCLTGF